MSRILVDPKEKMNQKAQKAKQMKDSQDKSNEDSSTPKETTHGDSDTNGEGKENIYDQTAQSNYEYSESSEDSEEDILNQLDRGYKK